VSRKKITQENTEVETPKAATSPVDWTMVFSWGVTVLLVASLVLVLLKINPFTKTSSEADMVVDNPNVSVPLPQLASGLPVENLARLTNIDTTIPDGVRQSPITYTVELGDSIFMIAKKFNVTAESILWANYDLLNDDPTFLKEGWKLIIPPTNGIYYKWKEGDTIDKIAEKYYVDPESIITWPGNNLDVSDPVTSNLDYIMIPGGYRNLVSWIQTVGFAPRSGATKVIAGPGGCITPETGPVGSTYFQWPVANHFLSGFDFTPYHLGIDIAAAEGTPVFASDSGTVVYAGWNDSGYGNLVAIDHNNGYKTIYGHLNSISVSCGSQVTAGSMIGLSGNTGKSTGGHLHFEIRLGSEFVNPWTVLP